MNAHARTIVLLAAGVFCAAPLKAEQTKIADCPHVAAVQLETAPTKGVVEFSLTPEVFSKTREDLADLRQ